MQKINFFFFEPFGDCLSAFPLACMLSRPEVGVVTDRTADSLRKRHRACAQPWGAIMSNWLSRDFHHRSSVMWSSEEEGN
jgi:hypothetical protein